MAKPIRIQLLRIVFSPCFLPMCHPKLFAQLPRSHRVTCAALSTSGRTKQIQFRFSLAMACVTRDSSPIPNRLITHRRRAVVCWHKHHANNYQ